MISGNYLLRRICYSGASFFVCTTITFFLLHLMPGDYITNYLLSLSNTIPKEAVEQFYHQFGLDLPLTQQYILYIVNILHGQWGYSYAYRPTGLSHDHGKTVLVAHPSPPGHGLWDTDWYGNRCVVGMEIGGKKRPGNL